MDELLGDQIPDKKKKVVELKCPTCGFKELKKVEDDYTIVDVCPKCYASKQRLSGIYEAISIYPEVLDDLKGIIEQKANIKEIKISEGTILFRIDESQYRKEYFPYFRNEFKKHKYVPFVRQSEEKEEINIIAAKGKEETKKQSIGKNIILLIAVLITTTWAGYILAEGDLLNGFLFALSLFFIVGTHELGHMAAARYHGIDYSLPYFIPVPPFISPIGTFGAVISSKSPTNDKNALFDLGASGPIAGFIVMVIVLAIGLSLSELVPVAEATERSFFQFLRPPPIMLFLIGIIFDPFSILPITTNELAISLHPIAMAGLIGAIMTMLNLMPVGFLDGGHISRSLLNTRSQKVLSYIVAFITFILGWWLMALLMILMSGVGHRGPLDDVSELSISRKIIVPIILFILVLCITIPVMPAS
ncbi:MAG: site-2 protease family protein [Candidatus Altiarchaeales archaeon]|nr:site-2 protease family protein [Candidatus Altiarchaeota archaeon]MBU4341182.1 site-2 protease family protein [Candidatus Altiarchaeota archaeon]MBU4437713.1 site-2 protease family protein [Candidatus Altiarchaeota archaeon]MCG2782029.1 site-2 protease family protein [Candidatus Altiarchaeales archaeon]